MSKQLLKINGLSVNVEDKEILHGINPVSYTHLDVYKRQYTPSVVIKRRACFTVRDNAKSVENTGAAFPKSLAGLSHFAFQSIMNSSCLCLS